MRHMKIRSSVLAAMMCAVQPALAQDRACCLSDGTCLDTNQSGCDLGAGEFLGEGSACATTECIGACCLADKACVEDTRDGCDAGAGSFQGAGTTCERHCPAKLSTVITYQGQLKKAGAPLNRTADLEFSLWTSAKDGDQVGVTLPIGNVLVKAGLFSAPLDFGIDAFNGNARWLEIAIRSPHDATDTELFTTLVPRQAVTAAPQAMFSSAPWKTSGTDTWYMAGNVGIGTDTPASLLHIRGNGTQEVSIWGGSSVPLLHFRNTRNGDDWILKHDGQKFHFQTEAAAGREVMTLQVDGKVGIGTTIPEADLHIFDGSAPTLKLQSDGTSEESGRLSLRQSNDTGVDMYYDGSSVEGLVFELYGAGVSEGKALYISNKNDSSRGYVGIGTTSPSAALDVAGQIRSSGANGGRVLVFNPNNQLASAHLSWNDDVARIRVGGNGAGAEGGFDIQTTGSKSLLRLYHNGDAEINGALHLGRNYAIGTNEVLRVGSDTNSWAGMYISTTGSDGQPYYGYKNANSSAFTYLGKTTVTFEPIWSLKFGSNWPLWVKQVSSTVGYTLNVRGNSNGGAALLGGDVDVNGTLTKNGGSFKIDHPLDPENKFLSHSFVESPDMMNIYNGNVVTDRRGYATVEMPDYFTALNRTFRYQLTVLDEEDSEVFIQAKIVKKIADGQFTLRTSEPQTEVSWQVTGIRQDAWAEAHRIPVVEQKSPSERGLYRNPEVRGQPPGKGIGFADRQFQAMELHRPELVGQSTSNNQEGGPR